MTVLIALKNKDKVYIGADTLIYEDGFVYSSAKSKVSKFSEELYILSCGSVLYSNIIDSKKN